MDRPKKNLSILSAVLFVLGVMLFADLAINIHHQYENGPYQSSHAKLINFTAHCTSDIRDKNVEHKLAIKIDGVQKETKRPFVGLYPYRICLFHKFIAVDDYFYLNSLSEGDDIVVITDKHGEFYLGMTGVLQSFLRVFLLFLLIVFLRKRAVHKRMSHTSEN